MNFNAHPIARKINATLARYNERRDAIYDKRVQQCIYKASLNQK